MSSRGCARRPRGEGADLILDPIGGKEFGRNFAMLAPLGLVVSYGRLDGPPDPGFVQAMREHHEVSPAVRFFTIHSFDHRPDIRAAATRALVEHLAAGRIKPLIHARLKLAEASRAHEMLESGEVIGKNSDEAVDYGNYVQQGKGKHQGDVFGSNDRNSRPSLRAFWAAYTNRP